MLQAQAHHQSKINWADLYLMAEAEAEPFADVHVVTAQSEFDRLTAERKFFDSLDNPFGSISRCDAVNVQESVTLSIDGEFSVVVNAREISEEATWKALDMVAEAMDQLNGEAGIVYFGKPLTFLHTHPSIPLH